MTNQKQFETELRVLEKRISDIKRQQSHPISDNRIHIRRIEFQNILRKLYRAAHSISDRNIIQSELQRIEQYIKRVAL